MNQKNNDKKSSGKDITEFSEEYYKALDEINENNDEDAKDSNSDYMDEIKEESEEIDQKNK